MAETISALHTYFPAMLPASKQLNKSLYRDDEVVADFLRVLKWCFIPIICFTDVWLFEKSLSGWERLIHASKAPGPRAEHTHRDLRA